MAKALAARGDFLAAPAAFAADLAAGVVSVETTDLAGEVWVALVTEELAVFAWVGL